MITVEYFWLIMHPLLFYNGGGSSLVAKLCLTLLRPHGLQPTRPLCTWDSPGKNTGVGHHFLLQRIFPTQRWNPDLLRLLHLLHWQADSLLLRHQGGPLFYNTLRKPHIFLVFFSPIQKNKPHKNSPLYGNPPSHFPPLRIPPGHHRAPALGALRHTSKSHWLSVLRMIMCMFQCCSCKSSHPRLLPLSPKVCSWCLCLLCCPAHCIVSTVFLQSIYIR